MNYITNTSSTPIPNNSVIGQQPSRSTLFKNKLTPIQTTYPASSSYNSNTFLINNGKNYSTTTPSSTSTNNNYSANNSLKNFNTYHTPSTSYNSCNSTTTVGSLSSAATNTTTQQQQPFSSTISALHVIEKPYLLVSPQGSTSNLNKNYQLLTLPNPMRPKSGLSDFSRCSFDTSFTGATDIEEDIEYLDSVRHQNGYLTPDESANGNNSSRKPKSPFTDDGDEILESIDTLEVS